VYLGVCVRALVRAWVSARMRVHVCVCACPRVCVGACVCLRARTWVGVRACLRACVCERECVCVSVFVCVCAHARPARARSFALRRMHACARTGVTVRRGWRV